MTIIELRAHHQDMAPPSVHPSGERLRWYGQSLDGRDSVFYPPASADWASLERGTRLLAAAVLASRRWPEEGARHEPLLALAGTLKWAGLSLDEALKVVKMAATYARDRKLDDRLLEVRSTHDKGGPVTGAGRLAEFMGFTFVTALKKALGRKEEGAARRLVVTAASVIRPRPVLWFWKDRLPLGMLSLLAGREGIGKTTLAYTLVADITRGRLPGRCWGTPRAVFIVATEDSWEHTVVPRLMAAEADLDLVFRINVEVLEVGQLDISLPDDVPALEELIREKDAALVLLDPVISRLSKKIDTHKDAEVRSALEPLARLADTTGACVLGIIHVNKGASRDPLNTVMGSRAFVAVARAVLFVVLDPDDEKVRLLGQSKNNAGRVDLPTLSFEIDGVEVGATDDGPIVTGRLRWTGESTRTIRSVVEEVSEGSDRTAIAEAQGWLTDHLFSRGGWDTSRNIKKEGKRLGHNEKALERAKSRLGLTSNGFGYPRKTVWAFPNAQVPEQGTFEESGS